MSDLDITSAEDSEPTLLDEVELAAEDLIDDMDLENEEEAEDTSEETTQTEDEPEAEADESEQTDEEEPSEAEGSEEDEEAEPEQSDEDTEAQAKREAYQRRQAEKQEREAAIKAAQQEYVAEGEDERDTALRQLQVDAYTNRVENNSSKLTNSYEKAIKDFDILSSSDPAIKAEVDAAIDAFQAQHVTVDQYGNPYEIRGDFYQALQQKAESLERLSGIKAKRQETAKTKEKSKAMPKPSRTPKEPAKDPLLEAFEEEAYNSGY